MNYYSINSAFSYLPFSEKRSPQLPPVRSSPAERRDSLKNRDNSIQNPAGKYRPVLQAGLIWFCAAFCLPAVCAGMAAAPLGRSAGAAALITGQLAGGFLFFLIGKNGEISAGRFTEASVSSFGQAGAVFFAVLNLVQMIFWTAFLIRKSAVMLSPLFVSACGLSLSQAAVQTLLILPAGITVLLLLLSGPKKLTPVCVLSAVSMLLFLLLLFRESAEDGSSFSFSGYRAGFGDIVSLSAALPLFCLPLIADYTASVRIRADASGLSGENRGAGRFHRVFCVSAVSAFAFIAGCCTALLSGLVIALRMPDIAEILSSSAVSGAGAILLLFPVSLSAFLCLRFAGVNFAFICDKIDGQKGAIAAGTAAFLFAAAVPADRFGDYFFPVTSAFIPMTAVFISDFLQAVRIKREVCTGGRNGASDKKEAFVRRNGARETEEESCPVVRSGNFILWIFGFLLFHILEENMTPAGSALSVFALVSAARIITGYLSRIPDELLILCRAAQKKLKRDPEESRKERNKEKETDK